MSSTDNYTTTEILLLFQSLAIHGTDTKAFTRTSELLTSNILIRENDLYNPARFTIDALRKIYLLTLRQELQTEAVGRDGSNSPKRPITPPPTNLQDAQRYKAKLPQLVAKYHLRCKEEIIQAVRDDEKRFQTLQREIAEIERGEWDNKFVKDSQTAKSSRQSSYSAVDKLSRQNSLGTAEKERLVGKSATPRGSPHLLRALPAHVSPRPDGLAISDVLNNTLESTASQPQPRESLPPTHSQHHRPSHSRTPSIDRLKPQYPPPKDWQWDNHFQNGLHQQHHPSNQSYGQHSPHAAYNQYTPAPNRGSMPSPHELPLPIHRSSLPSSHELPRPSNMSPLSPGHVILPPPHAMSRTPVASGVPHDTTMDMVDRQQYRPLGPHSPLIQQPMDASTYSQYGSQFGGRQATMSNHGHGQRSPHWPQHPTLPPPAQQYVTGYGPPPHANMAAQPNPSYYVASSAPQPQMSPIQVDTQHQRRQYSSPYVAGQSHNPLPPVPPASNTPKPRPRQAPLPQTPAETFIKHSSGKATRWTPNTTVRTPKLHREQSRPEVEPLSPISRPILNHADVQPDMPQANNSQANDQDDVQRDKTGGKPPSSNNRSKVHTRAALGRTRADSTTSSLNAASARSASIMSHADELSLDNEGMSAKYFKRESATPRPFEDTDVTLTDQPHGLSERRRGLLASPRRTGKRKRETSAAVAPPSHSTHVTWTRNFPKISASAIEHIGAHRNANLFALPLKERDAPGYRDIILRPQDLKSIRSAIVAGNKAGITVLATMQDNGAPYVSLPRSEDLVPPKGIVNNAQLEKELMRMFANAIMYNADLKRGVGPVFEREDDVVGEKVGISNMDGYELDEDGIVKDTKIMFADVEKIVSEMRTAERRVTESISSIEDSEEEDDVDELAGDEAVDRKRRRRA